MWANFSDPHHAWNGAESMRPKPEVLKLPSHWPDFPEMREQLADYFSEINRLDRTIGNVIEVLKSRGLYESTLIVFIGDNGCALPHGKGSLYDPGSNVPCVIRWPGVVKPGRDSKVLISGEDLAPTLLEAAGTKPGGKMSGHSFLALLKGEEFQPRKYLFVERGPHGSSPVSVDMTNADTILVVPFEVIDTNLSTIAPLGSRIHQSIRREGSVGNESSKLLPMDRFLFR